MQAGVKEHSPTRWPIKKLYMPFEPLQASWALQNLLICLIEFWKRVDARTSLKRWEERSLLSAAAAAHPSFQSAHNPQLLLPLGLDSRFDLHIFVDMYLHICIYVHICYDIFAIFANVQVLTKAPRYCLLGWVRYIRVKLLILFDLQNPKAKSSKIWDTFAFFSGLVCHKTKS